MTSFSTALRTESVFVFAVFPFRLTKEGEKKRAVPAGSTGKGGGKGGKGGKGKKSPEPK